VGLRGTPLLIAVGLATLLAPVLTVLLLRRVIPAAGIHRVVTIIIRLAAVVGCQVLAVSLTFLAVNNSFAFYSSWSDLFGVSTRSTNATIKTGSLVGPGQGSVAVVRVSGGPSRASGQVLVWLPPQYSEPAYAHTKFPVIMVLPGQPSNPEVTFSHFNFADNATEAISEHLARPFVAVFPPLMTNPPRDTECTDIPHGPQAETWLALDVRSAVLSHFRVTSSPKRWSLVGYSTGAFCAVKLALGHPRLFHDAAGLGGYYQPLTDNTTGDLFHGSKIRYDENSPLWLYGRRGLALGHRLLLVSGQQDTDSWSETQKMLQATRGNPAVSSLSFPTGGHNYQNYRNSLPQVLQWLAAGHDFG
jgi:enterochelin esterase-like enzyme